MNLKKAPALIALGLGASLLLSGCTGESTEAKPSPSASPSETVTPTPAPGSSGEVDSADVTTDLVPSESAPEWAAEAYANLPAGTWAYASNEYQVIATTDTFHPDELKAFVETLLNEGWEVAVEPEDTADSYVIGIANYETGENFTVIGMEKAVPDGSGTPSYPASSVIYSK